MEFSRTLTRQLLDPYRIDARAAAFSILTASGYFTQADAYFICYNPIADSQQVINRKSQELKKNQPRINVLIQDFQSRLITSNPNVTTPTTHQARGRATEAVTRLDDQSSSNKELINNEEAIKGGIKQTNDFSSKEAILQVLSDSLTELRGKDRADVAMKIADLMQMKREVVESDSSRISFYLPLQCFRCKLFQMTRNNSD